MQLTIPHFENLPSIKISLWLIHQLSSPSAFLFDYEIKLWTVSAAISAIRSWKEQEAGSEGNAVSPTQEAGRKPDSCVSTSDRVLTRVKRMCGVRRYCKIVFYLDGERKLAGGKKNFHRGTVSRCLLSSVLVWIILPFGSGRSCIRLDIPRMNAIVEKGARYGNARIIFLAV